MGSPLGPVLANVFMTELEIAMIPSLENYLIHFSVSSIRFVDDTFAFVLPDKIEYILNQLNSFDENIHFTFEMTLLTQQFTGNQHTQTFTLTDVHIHQYSRKKQQLMW